MTASSGREETRRQSTSVVSRRARACHVRWSSDVLMNMSKLRINVYSICGAHEQASAFLRLNADCERQLSPQYFQSMTGDVILWAGYLH
jgi:hypothetical protein